MKHDEFIGQVQNRAGLTSREEAEVATRAVLETLAERLAGNEPFKVASQLPKELAAYLKDTADVETKYTLDEFLTMVGRRENVDLSQATAHSRAVMEVLVEAISAGEVKDFRTQLPPEYDSLFTEN